MAASKSRRYLCSQLVTLRWGTESRIVNLEEICRNEAILEAEACVAVGSRVTLDAEKTRFHGIVTVAQEHEFGWRIRVELSPLTPWSLEVFAPEHLLDTSDL